MRERQRPPPRHLSPAGGAAVITSTSTKLLVITIVVLISSLWTFATAASPPPSNSNNNDDYQALVCLKLHLSSPGGGGGLLDSSWNQNNNSSLHFCSWPGVTCSSKARVVALDLESWGLDGEIPPCIGDLSHVTRVHFPNNQLTGAIPAELGRLRRLRYLNLSSNSISGTIPGALSSSASSLLRVIDLGSNSLHGQIPESLATLPNVSVLWLAGNRLTGDIPLSLGSASSSFLVSLVLANNSLTGSVPPALAAAHGSSLQLQVLDLTLNNLGGPIPPGLFNSTSLQRLSLGGNFFTGSIPSSVSSKIEYSPLRSLDLSANKLTGTIPPSLGNFSSLRRLLLSSNNFQGSIPASLSRIPNLRELDMSYNNLSGPVPESLYNMSKLVDLRLAINGLTGSIPSDVGYTLPSIKSLIFQRNNFEGRIPPSLASATNLEFLNLAQCAFHGIIPSFGPLSKLNQLILAANQLEAGDWTFLSSLINCTRLEVLSLGWNMLQGNLPSSVGSLASSLRALVLHANKMSGSIPSEIVNLTNLRFIRMEQNYFVGNLPHEIGNIANLTYLSLSQNKLSGQIPVSIGRLRQLIELYLQENNLSGPIPRALGDCKSLTTLNLSYNSLAESIPRELFTLYALSAGLDLSHNKLSGRIPPEIGGLINIGHVNFSDNHLSGQIPTALGACVHLETLHMEGNFLDGRIPGSFSNLRGISEIDLSRNNLSGQIPSFFQSFNSLKLLNLSFNNLDGPMPAGGIFQNSSEVFVQGNAMLCSSSPMLQLPLCHESSKHRRSSNILKIVGISVALALVSLSFVAFILLKRRKRPKHSGHPSYNGMKNFSYDDLVRATNGFSSHNLLGSGTYGSVYKGVLESEAQEVAIKVFKLDKLGVPKSFVAECEAFRNIRHRNIVRVISSCSTWDRKGDDFKALIIEYMAKGTLESWLYSEMESGPLSLSSRATIAADIASALDYLHNHCVPPIVHCDLKPSNVLLDDGMGARLSDFGLAKFIHGYSSSNSATSTSLGPRGSIGYIAPEYGFGSKISTEGDVYSYGILILEILTGKRPTDESFSNGSSLHQFVGNAFPQRIGEILDRSIIQNLGDGGVDTKLDRSGNHDAAGGGLLSCITQLVKIGLSCSATAPRDRPTMTEVCPQVAAIRQAISAL